MRGGGGVRARGTTFCFGSLMDSLDDCKQVGCRIMVLFSSVSTIYSFHSYYFHIEVTFT